MLDVLAHREGWLLVFDNAEHQTLELITPRLLLREFRPDDHVAVHAFASDPEVTRYTDWGPNSPRDTTTFLGEVAHDAGALPRTSYTLAVAERTDGALIGSVQLDVTSRPHRRGRRGYALARLAWGHGYATEAAALLRFGVDHLDLYKISAICDPDKASSARVLTKIGMRPEGHLRDHLFIRGQWRDRLLFAALPAED